MYSDWKCPFVIQFLASYVIVRGVSNKGKGMGVEVMVKMTDIGTSVWVYLYK